MINRAFRSTLALLTIFLLGGLLLRGGGELLRAFSVPSWGLLIPIAALSAYVIFNGRRIKRAFVGFRSERLVARKLRAALPAGWKLRHAIPWKGNGDVDHALTSPDGRCFAIETKTGAYTDAHLAKAVRAAGFIAKKKAPQQALLIIARRENYWQDRGTTLVVSADQLNRLFVHLGADHANSSSQVKHGHGVKLIRVDDFVKSTGVFAVPD